MRSKLPLRLFVWPVITGLLLTSCSSTQFREVRESYNRAFFSGNLEEADRVLKDSFESGDSQSRLLYLMEGGMLAHSAGDYKKSNRLFMAAEKLIDDRRKSLRSGVAAIVISDASTEYRGESFEQVMVKFYIALNFLLLEEYENARVYFRRVENLQREMKYTEQTYRQNLAARKLHGIVAEQQGDFNVARVQYKNILQISKELQKEAYTSFYILAEEEQNESDLERYRPYRKHVNAFDKNYNSIHLNKNLGQVVLIYQAGRSAVKESRGKIGQSQAFKSAFRASLHTSFRASKKVSAAGLSFSTIMLAVADAENPIPRYVMRDPDAVRPAQVSSPGGRTLGRSVLYTDYSGMAVQNFNEKYDEIIASNVASIAGRVIAALATSTVLARAAGNALRENDRHGEARIAEALVGVISGYAIGRVVTASLQPDLRSWSLVPSAIQIERFFFEPGQYELEIHDASGKLMERRHINVKENSLQFINVRQSADR